jgi:mono/diheme cytochrome c family protein
LPTTFHRLILHFCLLAFGVSRSLAAEKTTYDDQVFPIFQQSCLNCHNPDKTKGGLDLSSFSAAMKGGSGGKIAEPGDASSKILTSIMRTADPKMPPEGDALGAPQVAIIKAWIDGGLLENANSTARKPSAPKFSSAMNAAGGARPEGPPPMPRDLLLEPPVVATRGAAVRAIACSPWAPLIAVSSLKQVLLIDLNTLELIGILQLIGASKLQNLTEESNEILAITISSIKTARSNILKQSQRVPRKNKQFSTQSPQPKI